MRESVRWVVGSLMTVGLLTFFFPLVTTRIPIIGSQGISGYEAVQRRQQFAQDMELLRSEARYDDSSSAVREQDLLPISLRAAIAIPIEIGAAYVLCLAGLFGCLLELESPAVIKMAAAGAVASAAAIIQILAANSDLHILLRHIITGGSLQNDPFALLIQNIGILAVDSIQIEPGTGLYIVAASLFASAILAGLTSSPDPDEEPVSRRRTFTIDSPVISLSLDCPPAGADLASPISHRRGAEAANSPAQPYWLLMLGCIVVVLVMLLRPELANRYLPEHAAPITARSAVGRRNSRHIARPSRQAGISETVFVQAYMYGNMQDSDRDMVTLSQMGKEEYVHFLSVNPGGMQLGDYLPTVEGQRAMAYLLRNSAAER